MKFNHVSCQLLNADSQLPTWVYVKPKPNVILVKWKQPKIMNPRHVKIVIES